MCSEFIDLNEKKKPVYIYVVSFLAAVSLVFLKPSNQPSVHCPEQLRWVVLFLLRWHCYPSCARSIV